MDMTPQRWSNTLAYLTGVFGGQDEHLAGLMERASAAGLPRIAVAPEVGRLLQLLTGAVNARLVIEVGTLGGYSGIWIARGLAPGGKLITIEISGTHADFAQGEFERAGVAGRVQIRRGAALEVLPKIAREIKPGSVDLVFLDALKTEYAAYTALVRPLLREGGLLLADNALGAGYWIDDPPGIDANRDAADAFNRQMAGDPGFVTTCVPTGSGLLIARKIGVASGFCPMSTPASLSTPPP